MKFVHIPKTGGTSVCNALGITRIGHWVYHRNFSEFSWCVFRDPVDRFLSAFNHLKYNARNQLDKNNSATYIQGKELSLFIKTGLVTAAENQQHFLPQIHWIPDGVTHIVPFEKLNEGFKTMYQNIELPNVNHTERQETELTQKEIDIINRVYYVDKLIYESLI